MSLLLFLRLKLSIFLTMFLFIHLSFSSSSPKPPQPRMVGGSKCPVEEHPFTVSLFWQKEPHHLYCGGTLIFPKWVMTTVTCFFGRTNWVDLEVQAGSSRSRPNTVTNEVEDGQVRHGVNAYYFDDTEKPHWTNGFRAGPEDIALLLLNEAFELNDHLAVAKLPQPPSVPDKFCSTTIGMGWGHNSFETLTCLKMTMVPSSNCQGMKNQDGFEDIIIEDKILCSRSSGKGFCIGDFGGPLVCKDQPTIVIGIIRTTDRLCMSGRTTFTRVDQYLDWIYGTVPSAESGMKEGDWKRAKEGEAAENEPNEANKEEGGTNKKSNSSRHEHKAHVLLVVLLLMNAILY